MTATPATPAAGAPIAGAPAAGGPRIARPAGRTLAALAGEFSTARWTTRSGDGVLTLMSVAAFAVVTLVVNIVASGTWMFVERADHPTGLLALALVQDPSIAAVYDVYVILAAVACAMLVFPAISLATSATVLGARSRERRLTTLRLLGITRSEVSALGFLDVLLQILAGVVLGSALTLPALQPFTRLTFHATPVAYGELLMPWWAYILTALTVVLVAAAASAASLLRVQISPLAVTRRGAPKALRWWRLGVLAVVIIGFMVTPALSAGELRNMGVPVAGIFLLFFLATDLALPYVLQVASRLLAHAPSVTVSWAARRVAMAPKAAWRRIGAISMLALITAFFNRLPMGANLDDLGGAVRTVGEAIMPDIRTGLLLTVLFAFVLAGVSTMINQASAEFERADETRAMMRMGVSSRRAVAVSWMEVLGPLAGASIVSMALGWIMAQPIVTSLGTSAIAGMDPQQLGGAELIITALIVGLALMLLSLLAVLPIHRHIVGTDRRR